MNGAYPFSDKDKTKFRNLMQTIYFDFVAKAADSRKMSFAKMRSFAKGRVWSGEDALQNGLIDQLGNISTVFDIAKKRIGVPEGKKVLVDFYPKSEDSFEEFLEFIKNFRKISAKDISPLSKQIETFAFADKLFSIMPKTIQAQILYNLRLMEISKKESVLLTLPYYIN
jgi:protease-4